MDEGGTVSKHCRKDLRKQKLMEFLAAKGKLKPPNPKPYLREEHLLKKAAVSTIKTDPAMGKENQAPNDFLKNKGTKVQLQISKATSCSSGTLNGVLNKLNVQRGGTLPAFQVAKHPIVLKGPPQPVTLNKKPATTRAYTIAPLKSNISANNQPRKQPNMAVKLSSRPSSGKSLSNTACTTTSQSNNRPNSATHASISRPLATNGVRMSLGPISKTKTGLIPAVLQPRKTKSRATTVPAATTTTSATTMANRARSSTAIPAVVAQKSAMAQRETRPSTAVNRPVQKTTTAGTVNARIKVLAPSKTDCKPLAGKPHHLACQNRASATLKPTHVPSRPTFAPVKSGEKERVTTTAKSVVQPAKTAAQQVSEVKGAGNARPWKAGSRASSGAVSEWQAKALNRAMHAAVSELEQKDKIRSRTDAKKGDDSAKVPPSQAGNKGTGILSVPQTVPRSAKNISHVGWATDLKTPSGQSRMKPQTEGKKLTAAQEERMRKLQEWREAKGICYKRPPMPVKPRVRRTMALLPQPYWASMEEEEEAHSLICAVDTSLADCVKLLEEGCPPEQVKEVLSRLPAVAQKFAKYWVCQVRLMEHQGNLEVLPMFEEAVRVVLEPVDELRTVVFEILKKKNESQGPSSLCAQAEREERPAEGDQSLCAQAEREERPAEGDQSLCAQAEREERPAEGDQSLCAQAEREERPAEGDQSLCAQAEREERPAEGDQSLCAQAEREERPAEGDQSPEHSEDPMVTPKPVKALIRGEKGDSTVIKYKITATPGGFRSQQREPVRIDGQEVRFFTPVRRSVRIERSSVRYPTSLQDHDLCVTSYNHLMAEEESEGDGGEERGDASPFVHSTSMYIYRENEALKDQVQVQLVYEDD